MVETSDTNTAGFPLSSQNSGFRNNPALKPTCSSLCTPLLQASVSHSQVLPVSWVFADCSCHLTGLPVWFSSSPNCPPVEYSVWTHSKMPSLSSLCYVMRIFLACFCKQLSSAESLPPLEDYFFCSFSCKHHLCSSI